MTVRSGGDRQFLLIHSVNDYHPRHEDPSETGQCSPF